MARARGAGIGGGALGKESSNARRWCRCLTNPKRERGGGGERHVQLRGSRLLGHGLVSAEHDHGYCQQK